MSDAEGSPALAREEPRVPDLTGWLVRRDTIREFDPEAEIPDRTIREIVDAGRKVPTSGTVQMYSFLWLRDPSIRERIQELCSGHQPMVTEASHFLLVCIDLRRVRKLHEHRGLSFELSPLTALLKGGVDASLAGQGAMTVAESRGYGVCPVGAISENLLTICEVADVPTEVLPIWGLAIGLPRHDEPVRSTPRIPLEAVLHEDEYRDPSPALMDDSYAVMNTRYDSDSGQTWEDSLSNYWTADGSHNRRAETLHEAMRQQGFFADNGVCESRGPGTARE